MFCWIPSLCWDFLASATCFLKNQGETLGLLYWTCSVAWCTLLATVPCCTRTVGAPGGCTYTYYTISGNEQSRKPYYLEFVILKRGGGNTYEDKQQGPGKVHPIWRGLSFKMAVPPEGTAIHLFHLHWQVHIQIQRLKDWQRKVEKEREPCGGRTHQQSGYSTHLVPNKYLHITAMTVNNSKSSVKSSHNWFSSNCSEILKMSSPGNYGI